MESNPETASTRRDFIRHSLITAGSLALPTAAASGAAKSNATVDENRREGARDWQLTRVRLDRDGFRSPWVEGYCSKQSVQAGEDLEIMVSADPARRVHLEIFRSGYYGERSTPSGRVRTAARQTTADAATRSQECPRVPLGSLRAHHSSRFLAKRRVSGETDHDSR
jgi:hypothetical protein